MTAALVALEVRVGARRAARLALVGAVLAFIAGLAVMLVASTVYGDWYLIRLPWGDLGMWLMVLGLAASGLAAIAVVIVEPLGWWRTLAGPGIVISGFAWVILVAGLGVGGGCCTPSAASIATTLYSYPPAIPFLTLSTASILLPFAGASLRRGVSA